MTVITAAHVEQAKGTLVIGRRDIVTPLARDRAKELGVQITVAQTNGPVPVAPAPSAAPSPGAAIKPKPVARAVSSLVPRPARSVTDAPLMPRSGVLYRRGAPVDTVTGATSAPRQGDASDIRPKVAVIGAGHVGAMTALRLAECDLFSNVTLVDIVPGLAAGLALDMWHSAGLRRFTTRIAGDTEMAGVAGADFIVVTAGRPRQPGMSRTDLTAVNAEIIRGVAMAIRSHAPNAIVVVVTNPLEEMTHLTCKLTGFPPERVIGMAGLLDTARFSALVGLTGIVKPQDVHAFALGSHGPEMVIPMSQASANGLPLERIIDRERLAAIVERTRESGAEVVKLLQKGSAYFSPAESAATMVQAMAQNTNEILAACVQSKGAYGLTDTRIGLPVRLGRTGVAEVVSLPLRPDELAALREAANRIAARIREIK